MDLSGGDCVCVCVCVHNYVCPHVSVTLAFGQSTWAVVCVFVVGQLVLLLYAVIMLYIFFPYVNLLLLDLDIPEMRKTNQWLSYNIQKLFTTMDMSEMG